ncbi:hypothetical protein BDR04DRAFT_1227989 [Suillus decipiens]|nr:hypothetical protein BDR04DRAFT_1227989 [Suillus decipiens]
MGEVFIFINLTKYFHNERPFYAFRARGFDVGYPYFTSMDEMVSCYTAAVKKTQATGPYTIAGYSYSSVAAFEVAKRLEATGNESCMLHLSFLLGIVSKHDADDLSSPLTPLTKQEQLDFVWKKSPAKRIVELQLTLEKLDRWNACSHTNTLAALEFFYPIPFAGTKIDLLN